MRKFNAGDKIIVFWDDGDNTFTSKTVFKSIENGWVKTEAGDFREDRVKHIVKGHPFNIGDE